MRTTNNSNRRVLSNEYVYGSAAPKRNVQVVADPRQDPMRKAQERAAAAARRKQAKAGRMNRMYVAFLTGAAVAMIAMCYQFLALQTSMNQKVADISKKEVELASLKAENDFNLIRMEESVDLDQIREIATERLGMVEPTETQIVTYSYDNQGYVRQYTGVPNTDGSSVMEYFDE